MYKKAQSRIKSVRIKQAIARHKAEFEQSVAQLRSKYVKD